MKILYFLFYIISIINAQIITQHLGYYKLRPTIKLFYPQEKNEIDIILNSYISISLIDKDDFKQTISSQVEFNQEIQLYLTYKTFLYQTSYMIDNLKPCKCKLYINKSSTYFFHDFGLGLAYKFDDEQFSLIHTLYNNNLIEKKQYAFFINQVNDSFHIGGIPNNEHLYYPYKGRCSIDKTQREWGCNLTFLSYKDNFENTNITGIFYTGLNRMFYSDFLFSFFEKKVFKDYISNKTCVIEINDENKKSLLCYSGINNDDYIELTLGKMTIQVKLRDLFIKDSSFVFVSQFSSNPFQKNNYTFFIGFGFLKLFNYSIFDYDTSTVELYSDTNKITNVRNQSHLLFIIMVIIICISNIFMNLYIIIQKNYNNI